MSMQFNKVFRWICLAVFLLTIFSPTLLRAGDLPVTTKVVDGDTIEVQQRTIRLACIDAPESNQNGGTEATEKLKQLVLDKAVQLDVRGSDRYGREIAIVRSSGTNINKKMVETGNAFVYYKYLKTCPNEQQYPQAERQAQQNRRGIWQDFPCPPWEFRRGECPSATSTRKCQCHTSYPDFCIPPPPPDLNCDGIEETGFPVRGEDPHNFDGNHNGYGCE